jgi:hypothetical protein
LAEAVTGKAAVSNVDRPGAIGIAPPVVIALDPAGDLRASSNERSSLFVKPGLPQGVLHCDMKIVVLGICV